MGSTMKRNISCSITPGGCYHMRISLTLTEPLCRPWMAGLQKRPYLHQVKLILLYKDICRLNDCLMSVWFILMGGITPMSCCYTDANAIDLQHREHAGGDLGIFVMSMLNQYDGLAIPDQEGTTSLLRQYIRQTPNRRAFYHATDAKAVDAIRKGLAWVGTDMASK